jgi:hypothetical protein
LSNFFWRRHNSAIIPASTWEVHLRFALLLVPRTRSATLRAARPYAKNAEMGPTGGGVAWKPAVQSGGTQVLTSSWTLPHTPVPSVTRCLNRNSISRFTNVGTPLEKSKFFDIFPICQKLLRDSFTSYANVVWLSDWPRVGVQMLRKSNSQLVWLLRKLPICVKYYIGRKPEIAVFDFRFVCIGR